MKTSPSTRSADFAAFLAGEITATEYLTRISSARRERGTNLLLAVVSHTTR